MIRKMSMTLYPLCFLIRLRLQKEKKNNFKPNYLFKDYSHILFHFAEKTEKKNQSSEVYIELLKGNLIIKLKKQFFRL